MHNYSSRSEAAFIFNELESKISGQLGRLLRITSTQSLCFNAAVYWPDSLQAAPDAFIYNFVIFASFWYLPFQLKQSRVNGNTRAVKMYNFTIFFYSYTYSYFYMRMNTIELFLKFLQNKYT